MAGLGHVGLANKDQIRSAVLIFEWPANAKTMGAAIFRAQCAMQDRHRSCSMTFIPRVRCAMLLKFLLTLWRPL